jgi:predicted DCC family thiol-disulfide oxidoreductase YuxK
VAKDLKSIILFDGLCKLCNKSIKFIINRDNKSYFKFIAIESSDGQKLIAQFKLDIPNNDSLILIDDNTVRYRTEAILFILFRLHYFYYLLGGLLIIPSFIRDFFYNLVAKNRYRVFGKETSCKCQL